MEFVGRSKRTKQGTVLVIASKDKRTEFMYVGNGFIVTKLTVDCNARQELLVPAYVNPETSFGMVVGISPDIVVGGGKSPVVIYYPEHPGVGSPDITVLRKRFPKAQVKKYTPQ